MIALLSGLSLLATPALARPTENGMFRFDSTDVVTYLDSADGTARVWYSTEGEVISLQNGRVVNTAGLETDWRAVKNFSLPAWKDMIGRNAVTYSRERDEMPGYRFGIKETVSLYPVDVPSNAKLVGITATTLRWYEESVIGQPGGLPSARFAVQVKDGATRIVYGEQCLAKTLCIAWQVWPAAQ
jgi:hypothetical protein